MANFYGLIDMGPHEVLFLKPTTPGVLTRAQMQNTIALLRARNAYQAECCDYRFEVVGYGFFSVPRERFDRRDGAPSFASFFNANLDRWYK